MRWALSIAVALSGCGSATCAGSTPSNQSTTDVGSESGGDTSPNADSALADVAVDEGAIVDADVPPSPCGFELLSTTTEKPRSWAACGAACAEIAAARAGFAGAYSGSAVATVEGDGIFLRLESARPGRNAVEIIRVGNGAIHAIVEGNAGCFLGARGSAFLLPFVSDGSKLFLGYAQPMSMGLSWHDIAVDFPTANTADFQWKLGFGSAFFGGRVAVLDAPTGASFTTIDPGGAGNVNAAAAFDTQIVYSRVMLERAHIRTFNVGDSATTPLVESSSYGVAGLALSSNAMVWIGVHGPESNSGRYTAAELYWSPRVTKVSEVKVTNGPALPSKFLLRRVVTAGDYAATIGCTEMPPAGCELLVVRLSDSRVWRFRARSGHAWTDALAVSNQYVVVGEATTSSPTGALNDILRLETGRLNEVAW